MKKTILIVLALALALSACSKKDPDNTMRYAKILSIIKQYQDKDLDKLQYLTLNSNQLYTSDYHYMIKYDGENDMWYIQKAVFKIKRENASGFMEYIMTGEGAWKLEESPDANIGPREFYLWYVEAFPSNVAEDKLKLYTFLRRYFDRIGEIRKNACGNPGFDAYEEFLD